MRTETAKPTVGVGLAPAGNGTDRSPAIRTSKPIRLVIRISPTSLVLAGTFLVLLQVLRQSAREKYNSPRFKRLENRDEDLETGVGGKFDKFEEKSSYGKDLIKEIA
jgi:hypothetical protein